jgi:hypothetical protein
MSIADTALLREYSHSAIAFRLMAVFEHFKYVGYAFNHWMTYRVGLSSGIICNCLGFGPEGAEAAVVGPEGEGYGMAGAGKEADRGTASDTVTP